MSLPEDQIDKDARRFRTWREFIKDAILVIAGLLLLVLLVGSIITLTYLIPAIKDWQKASLATSQGWQAAAGPDGQNVARLMDKVNSIADKIGAGAAEIAPTLQAVRSDAEKLGKTVDTLNFESRQIGNSVQARMLTFDGALVSARGAVDEGRAQIKGIGDAAHEAVNTLNAAIKDGSARINRIADDGAALLETTSPQVASILSHLDTVTVDADGLIVAAKPTLDHVASTAGHADAIAADLQTWAHGFLIPAPVKGFWPKTLRVLKIIALPAMDGAKLYFTLRPIAPNVTLPTKP